MSYRYPAVTTALIVLILVSACATSTPPATSELPTAAAGMAPAVSTMPAAAPATEPAGSFPATRRCGPRRGAPSAASSPTAASR